MDPAISGNTRILFVDDDRLLVERLPGLIESGGGCDVRGLEFSGIESAGEVIRVLTAAEYHLLLLNIMMPGITGLKLTVKIRRMGLETPIILHTGYSLFERAVEAMRVGAADLIIKPFSLEDVRSSVQGVLGETELQPDQFRPGQSRHNTLKVVRLPFPRGLNPEGLTREWYQDGRLMAEFSCRNGKPKGLSKVYRRSGTLICEANFANGIPEGPTKWYNCNGRARILDDYHKGEKTRRRIYDLEGRVAQDIRY